MTAAPAHARRAPSGVATSAATCSTPSGTSVAPDRVTARTGSPRVTSSRTTAEPVPPAAPRTTCSADAEDTAGAYASTTAAGRETPHWPSAGCSITSTHGTLAPNGEDTATHRPGKSGYQRDPVDAAHQALESRIRAR